MRRSLNLLIVLASTAIGCKSSQPMTDPFLPARVPPPSTGAITPPPGSYGSAPPPAGGLYSPPGNNFSYGGTLTPVTPPTTGAPLTSPPPPPPINVPAYQSTPTAMPAVHPPSIHAPAPTTSGWNSTNSGNEPPTSSLYDRQALQEQIKPLNETASSGSLARAASASVSNGVAPGEQGLEPMKQLTDLPQAQPLGSPSDSGVQPASYNAPAGAPPRTARTSYSGLGREDYQPAEPRPRKPTTGQGPNDQGATYGYDVNYAWVQGQLEYSEATKQWKLRYIPIDGPTDRFGGSVVLASTPDLKDYRAGDFVSIKGQLDGSRNSQGALAPLYRVQSIDRLTD